MDGYLISAKDARPGRLNNETELRSMNRKIQQMGEQLAAALRRIEALEAKRGPGRPAKEAA